MRKMKINFINARQFSAIFVVLLTSVAQASIPPSHFLVKQLVQKHATQKWVRMKTQLSLPLGNGMKAENSEFVRVTLWIQPSTGHYRVRMQNEAGKEIYSREQRTANQAAKKRPLGMRLLTEQNTLTLSRELKEESIPVYLDDELMALSSDEERRGIEKETLGRFGPQKTFFSWIIGKQDSQLWIEKDSFLPQRLILSRAGLPGGSQNAAASTTIEYRYENFRAVGEFPFPRVLIVFNRQTLEGDVGAVLRSELSELLVQAEFVELKSPLVATTSIDAEPALNQKLVSGFREWLE